MSRYSAFYKPGRNKGNRRRIRHLPRLLACVIDVNVNEQFRRRSITGAEFRFGLVFFAFAIFALHAYISLIEGHAAPAGTSAQFWDGLIDFLFSTGTVIGPILHVMALLTTLWAVSLIVEPRFFWLPALIFIGQPAIFDAFAAGQTGATGNGFLVLCSIGIIGCTLRILITPERIFLCIILGFISALALWISVDAMIVIGLAMGVQGLRWLIADRNMARCLAAQSAAAGIFIFVTLLIERGKQGLETIDYNVVSVAHLGLFMVSAVVWIILSSLNSTSKETAPLDLRAIVTVIVACIGGAFLWLVLPDFFTNAATAIAELVHNISPDGISPDGILKLQPLTSPQAIMWLGQVLVTLPWLAWQVIHTSRGATDEHTTYQWLFIIAGLIVFADLAISQARWAPYMSFFLIIGYTHLVMALIGNLETRLAGRRLIIANVITGLALAFWPLGLMAL